MPTLPVRSGPMALIERQFEALSPRDRKLLVGLLLFFVLLFVGGFWYLLDGALESKASRVRDAKEKLVAVQALEAEYQAASAQFTAQEDRLRQYSNQPVSAFIEELAKEHDLSEALNAVRNNKSEEVGDLLQTRHTIELKKAPQESLYRFLHGLETSGYPAKVEQATFKVVYVKKEKMMDLTLELVVLSLKEG